MEKKLEGQEDMAIKIDLEKSYATIPREMTMGTQGWMGVPEAARPGWWKGRMRTRRAGCCVNRECQESPK